ncbi:MAG: hypothetical protein E7365_00415 [Clostridiales bacterium]|nr:hypothetical protein [Clostridiales bacterium]
MSQGKFSKDNPLIDIIQIEGQFVSSFLAQMPPIFLKLYVYLIYLCNHHEVKADTLSAVSQQTGISTSDLNDALEYLSKNNLINYTSRPFSFEILSAAQAAKHVGTYAPNLLTAYADFFAGIRALFTNRSISNHEYDKARDWVEIFGLSVECALLLISHCIDEKGANVSFNYIDTVARAWADQDITTIAKAEDYLLIHHARTHEVSKLLLHLGLKRTPTVDEINLYNHWVNDWGFDLKAIKAACQETTKSLNPNLAYINSILETLHNLNLHSEKQIKAYLLENSAERRLISVILFELGEKSRTVSSIHINSINNYKKQGFKEDTLIFVAKLICEKGMHTFQKYTQKLDELYTNGSFTVEQITEYFENSTVQTSQKKNSNNFKGRNEKYGDSLYSDPSKLEV